MIVFDPFDEDDDVCDGILFFDCLDVWIIVVMGYVMIDDSKTRGENGWGGEVNDGKGLFYKVY